MLLLLLLPFCGCAPQAEPQFPFDREKAFRFSREGLITGEEYSIRIEPAEGADVYEYVTPAPEEEDGMRDAGAEIYIVGRRAGEVTVTVRRFLPTDGAWEESFRLRIGEDLRAERIK